MQQQANRVTRKLQSLKGIYLEDKLAKPIQVSQEFKNYVSYLTEKGLKMNTLETAEFYTKNGLPYIGLVAKEKIPGDSILVQVPKNLMLTTKTAFFSEIQEIFEAFPQYYSQYHHGGWQDRVLLTYILYQWQFREKSQWFHLIRNLPKDIDYLIFWSDKELTLLNDQQLVNNAKKELEEFNLTYETLKSILERYPQHFNKEAYSYENVKWIYIHLVSRCFGSNIAQVSFVPFCEMFNHENTNVRYTGLYRDDNPDKPEEREAKQINSSDEESDGEKDDPIESDQEYPDHILELVDTYRRRVPTYKQIDLETQEYRKKVNHKNFADVSKLQQFEEKQGYRTELQILYMKYKRWVQENVNIKDNFSMIFINKIIEQMQVYVKKFDEDTITFEQAQKGLNQVNESCQTYLELIKQYFLKYHNVKDYELKQFEIPDENKEPSTVKEVLEQQIVEGVELFSKKEDWEEDKFDDFIIKSSSSDVFDKGAQVYFSYGNLSNRHLLLRYGFTLEYNQYEYVFVRVNYLDEIKNAIDIADYFKLPKYAKFKIKFNQICQDLILYYKLVNWKYDKGVESIFGNTKDNLIEPINQSIQALQKFKKSNFKRELEEEEQMLKNKELSYHQYFAQIFKIDRQRIIESQIEALQLVKAILQESEQPQQRFQWSKIVAEKFINKI